MSMLFFGPFLLPMLLFQVFWIWMLIDAIMNQEEDKIMWVLLIAFLNLLGAILYFFMARGKRK